jgi:hypothetical protein
MDPGLANHVSLLAAHIYAAGLVRHPGTSSLPEYERMRVAAINQAVLLWTATLDFDLPNPVLRMPSSE